MEKDYSKHIADLTTQLENSESLDVEEYKKLVQKIQFSDIIVVGSGGSMTSASFFAHLFEYTYQKPCHVYTPLKLKSSSVELSKFHVILFSAEGKNPDILEAFHYGLQHCASVNVVVNRPDSPLVTLCQLHDAPLFCFQTPYKDGFLATISTFYTMVASLKAFSYFNKRAIRLINSFSELTSKVRNFQSVSNIIMVHSPELLPTALDFEARSHESGLFQIQLCDFRNFAHGRHYGAYKNRTDTLVLILSDSKTKVVSEATFDLISEHLTVLKFDFDDPYPIALFNSFLFSLTFFSDLATKKGIDPNTVNVPHFGRQLYNLRVLDQNNITESSFSTAFGGIIFDYDGTLCFSEHRFEALTEEITGYLVTLLENQIMIGVATGRGKSAGVELRKAIPEKFWSKVIIGYYNGSIIKTLGKELDYSKEKEDASLNQLLHAIEHETWLSGVSTEVRPTQITYTPTSDNSALLHELYEYINISIAKHQFALKCFKSSHSVDVVAQTTSKLNLLIYFKQNVNVMTLGDCGQAGGNDHELLSHPFSFSVNEPYPTGPSGQTIAPSELKELDATLWLLKRIEISKGSFVLVGE